MTNAIHRTRQRIRHTWPKSHLMFQPDETSLDQVALIILSPQSTAFSSEQADETLPVFGMMIIVDGKIGSGKPSLITFDDESVAKLTQNLASFGREFSALLDAKKIEIIDDAEQPRRKNEAVYNLDALFI